MDKQNTVVIVGRPNVGKSTLFNRLVRRRLAITSPVSGTTRDGALAEADFSGKSAVLLDTGGYRLSSGNSEEAAIDKAVRERALKAAENADVVLLVVEAGECTAEDEYLIQALRPLSKKIILAVNKTEGGRLASSSYEWARFGFKNMLFISAEHGDNIELLRERTAERLTLVSGATVKNTNNDKDSENPIVIESTSDSTIESDSESTCESEGAIYSKSDSASENESAIYGESVSENENGSVDEKNTSHSDVSSAIRLALVGRPNTGKSTLLNRLTHSNLSIISPIAGTTRDCVEGSFNFEGVPFSVLDTAGIRKKSRVVKDIEYYSVNRAIRALDDCDIAVILIDSQEGISGQDKKICDRALDAGRAVIFALSKWDTQPKGRSAARSAIEEVRNAFPQMAYSPVVEVSALQGTGLVELLRTCIAIKRQLERRVETSALNIALHDWITRRPPPAAKSGRFKPRYITQVGTNPVRFVLFARGAHDAPKTYLTYIKNSIRRGLGFDTIPVVLEVRESSRVPRAFDADEKRE